MGKRSNGTRGTNSSYSAKSRKAYAGGGIDKKVDAISFPLFGNTSTMAVKVNDVFKQKYQKEESEKVRASVETVSSFSKPTGKYEYVSVDKIHPTQEYIGANNLKAIASINFDSNEVPYGVQRNGNIYIIDGHHRAAVAILKGNKKIRILLN